MPGLAQHAAGALLDDGELDAEVEQRVGGSLRVALADRDLALLAVADRDRDMLQRALHLLGGCGGRLPEHRPVVEVEHRVSGLFARASHAAKCALRLGSSDRPVTVDQ